MSSAHRSSLSAKRSQAHVAMLRRYPVKSMLGEEADELHLGRAGVVGDRAYGFVDVETGKRISAKRAKSFGALLYCRARFLSATTEALPSPAIEVVLPDGRAVADDDAQLTRAVSELLGREVRLVKTAPDGSGFAAPGGLLDAAGLHIVAESTLRMLAGRYPDGDWDPRRMRPNIVVAGDEPADDGRWLGCDLHIGAEVVVRIAGPTPRCLMTTLAQPGLAHDPGILRTIASASAEAACAGWYADVLRAGVVRTGDRIDIEYR